MYTFEFTSEYVKKSVRNSDNDRELLKERKTAVIAVKVPKTMQHLHEMLHDYAEKHVRCIAENA